MAVQIFQEESPGGRLGSALATGLSGTLGQLASNRANRLKTASWSFWYSRNIS